MRVAMRRHPDSLPPLDRLQRYSIEEAASYLRMSRALLMQRIAAGSVVTITDGRRRYVPGREIERLSAPPDLPPAA
jgi:hypothetical protein